MALHEPRAVTHRSGVIPKHWPRGVPPQQADERRLILLELNNVEDAKCLPLPVEEI
jgi:hypothetical protein